MGQYSDFFIAAAQDAKAIAESPLRVRASGT
jgi:hypothetical protein